MDEEVRRISEIFRQETAQYDKAEKQAKLALDNARQNAENMRKQLEKEQKRRANGEERVFEASIVIENAKKNLEILGQGEIEIVSNIALLGGEPLQILV